MRNVLIVNGSGEYVAMFKRLGFGIVSSFDDADLVCFTGGADVSPEMYGAKKHQYTWNDVARDAYEMDMFNRAREDNIPFVGICRGGQFLNVMNGGEMYQHVDAHTRSHHITDVKTGEVVYVSSTHHQMMKPTIDAELVAYSLLGGKREWYEGVHLMEDESDKDIEVVYYPQTKSLCFQPHPEFQAPEYESMFRYFESLLNRFIFTEQNTHHFACSC